MWKPILLLLASLGMLWVTGSKLHKMRQIKGWADGAEVRAEVVTQTWHQTAAEHPRGRDAYWLAWSDPARGPDVRTPGGHRTNVTAEVFAATPAGGTLEVVRLPGERFPYTRDGIFVSDGNFVTDGILLGIEALAALAAVAWLGWNVFAGRTRRGPRRGAALRAEPAADRRPPRRPLPPGAPSRRRR